MCFCELVCVYWFDWVVLGGGGRLDVWGWGVGLGLGLEVGLGVGLFFCLAFFAHGNSDHCRVHSQYSSLLFNVVI